MEENAVWFAAVALVLGFIVVIRQTTMRHQQKGGGKKNDARCQRVEAIAQTVNWNTRWPTAKDLCLFINFLPRRIKRSQTAIHTMIMRHFTMERQEVWQMMRVYRRDILQRILEEDRRRSNGY